MWSDTISIKQKLISAEITPRLAQALVAFNSFIKVQGRLPTVICLQLIWCSIMFMRCVMIIPVSSLLKDIFSPLQVSCFSSFYTFSRCFLFYIFEFIAGVLQLIHCKV
ncbi:hypothetical protein MAP00_006970 [Monascus purpureus]|nr:hypothetical protein MAP00_006970 [Monascus purpureus]